MNRTIKRFLLLGWMLGMFCGITLNLAWAADWLKWDRQRQLVEAEVEGLDLIKVLEGISEATTWQVYLEPDTHATITAKFVGRPPGKALDLLLGDLNRVLLPSSNGTFRLLVFRTSESQATRRIHSKFNRREGTTKPIPNELIVRVKPGTDIEKLAQSLGGKVVGKIPGLDAYRLRFEDEAATELARRLLKESPDVASVGNNYPIFEEVPSQRASGAPPLDLHPRADPNGDQIVVGLIDTQIDPVKSGLQDFLLPSMSITGPSAHPSNQPMHGDTMARAIMGGVSMMLDDGSGTAVRILSVDVYGGNAISSTFDVARGTYDAINAGAMIINLSMGSDIHDALLHEVIQAGASQDVLFFAAAGNEPGAALTFPAAYEEVIAVTARDVHGNVASFANSGEFVDIGTPGVVYVEFDGQTWRAVGTSVSSAYGSGMAAALKQQTGASWKEIALMVRKMFALQK